MSCKSHFELKVHSHTHTRMLAHSHTQHTQQRIRMWNMQCGNPFFNWILLPWCIFNSAKNLNWMRDFVGSCGWTEYASKWTNERGRVGGIKWEISTKRNSIQIRSHPFQHFKRQHNSWIYRIIFVCIIFYFGKGNVTTLTSHIPVCVARCSIPLGHKKYYNANYELRVTMHWLHFFTE